jgi:hypothetical protein
MISIYKRPTRAGASRGRRARPEHLSFPGEVLDQREYSKRKSKDYQEVCERVLSFLGVEDIRGDQE